jgi:hypothetical protein
MLKIIQIYQEHIFFRFSLFFAILNFSKTYQKINQKLDSNTSITSQFSSNSIFLGEEGSLVGYEVEKALAIALEIIPA